MRVGQNPARYVENVAQPAGITVTLVNFIPFLSGYYEQSLDVLKAVVESLHSTRDSAHPYDVMVFDNHSCAEVRSYLLDASQQGRVQYLVLSDTNIGKIGAWNYMFSAAQGEYVVFCDGDILFRPGWLKASLDLFEAFPNAGMVTARPLSTPMEFSTSTLEWARQNQVLEEDQFIDWDTYWEHVRSLGVDEAEARQTYAQRLDHRLTFGGRTAFVGATHFQFMARSEVLRRFLPLKSEQPMRGERALDIAFNDNGYLRLTTPTAYVVHLGNRLTTPVKQAERRKGFSLRKLFLLPGIRHVLLWAHNRIFRLYFLDKG